MPDGPIRNRPRSLAAPIVLIVLGVIFLLVNFAYLSWFQLGHYFARYWPVLLIVWGVVKLFETRQDRAAGRPPRGIGLGGLLLLILLLLFGIAATTASRMKWHEFRNHNDMH